jgi:cell division septation protein DedD
MAATDASRTLSGGSGEGASSFVESSAGRESAWTVQVGAGIKKSLVEEQVAQLKAKGYEAYMVETERDGQIWYRVRVGRFKTRGEAEALRENLASRKAYRSLFITKG